MMRVREVMTSPVVMVGPDHHLKSVARLLVELTIGAVPVVDEDGRLAGIVSEADLVGLEAVQDPRAHALPAPANAPVPVTVSDLMTADVVTLRETDDVAEAARLMLRHGYRSIPVVTGDRVVGIVARQDLLAVLARRDTEIRAELDELLGELAGIATSDAVEVADGVVTLTGPADPTRRRVIEVLARTVPGVLGIRFAGDRIPAGT
jgi:predicted transcriptional regulator